MSGELVPSQFRYTTTNNRDFVIGDPTDSNLDQPKYLVFQMSNLPGYNNNPHIKAEKICGNWKISLSENGSSTVNFAYVDRNNTFTGTNTFQNTTLFNNSVSGTTATFTTLNTTNLNVGGFNATGNVSILGDLTVTGTTTQLNVTNVAVADKNVVLNHGGSTVAANGAGLSVEGDSGAIIGGVSLSSTDWAFTVPGRSNSINLRPPVAAGGQAVLSSDNVTSAQTFYFPQMPGTNQLMAVFSGISNQSSLTGDRAIYLDSNKSLATANATSTELGYLSGVTSNIQTQLNGKAAAGAIPDISGKADTTYVNTHVLSYTVTNSPSNTQVLAYNGTNLTWTTPAAPAAPATGFDTAAPYVTTGTWTNSGDWTFSPTVGKYVSINNNGKYGVSYLHISTGGPSFYENYGHLEIATPNFASATTDGVHLVGYYGAGDQASGWDAYTTLKLTRTTINGFFVAAAEIPVATGTGIPTPAGSAIILKDRVDANKYALSFENGILTVTQV